MARLPRNNYQTEGDSVRKQINQMNARIVSLDNVRSSWVEHWGQLAEFILPRRYRWLSSGTATTISGTNRGRQINQRIINSTATQAARDCASGIMSGAMSPTRPWFRLKLADDAMMDQDIKIWCEEVTRRMMEVMSTSNYYGAKGIQNLDLVVFGTAPLIIEEDAQNVINCLNPCAGEYYCAIDARLEVNTLVRQFTMTAQALGSAFGDKVSSTVKSLLQANGTGKDTEVVVRHMIEPNHEYVPSGAQHIGSFGIPRHFQFREFYWEANNTEGFLRTGGFLDKPFSCPRWDVVGDDAYGRSPGMDALGDVKQLQAEEMRKGQAIDKIVNPPMVASVSMKNEPASLLPGAVNYVADVQGAGFKPAITVAPNLRDMKEDLAQIEGRIKDVFFNDLFLMISNLDTVRSATEIDARREEKLVMLGPVMDRLQREGLAADIKRIYAIMGRRGMIPPPPAALRGLNVKVDYISLLADLQRASITTSIERAWAFAGNVGAAVPEVLDNLDPDASLREYGNALRAPPSIFRSKSQVDQRRNARAAEQAQAAQMQEGMAAVQAGKVLSETDVGGGQNALSAIINGAGAV